jgi:hypothetical protein
VVDFASVMSDKGEIAKGDGKKAEFFDEATEY